MTDGKTIPENGFINNLDDLADYAYGITVYTETAAVKVTEQGEWVKSVSTTQGNLQTATGEAPFFDATMLEQLNAIQTGEADPVLSCRERTHIAQVDHFLLYESLLEDPELDQPRRYRGLLTDLNLDRTPVRIRMRTKIECSDGSIVELAEIKTGYIAEDIPPGNIVIRAGHLEVIDDPEQRRQEEERLKAQVKALIDALKGQLQAEEQQLKARYASNNALLAEEGKFTQLLILSGAFVTGVLQRAEDTYQAVTDLADISPADILTSKLFAAFLANDLKAVQDIQRQLQAQFSKAPLLPTEEDIKAVFVLMNNETVRTMLGKHVLTQLNYLPHTDIAVGAGEVGANLFASFVVPGGGALASGLVLSNKAQQAAQALLDKLKLLVFNNRKTGHSQLPKERGEIPEANITDKQGDPDKLSDKKKHYVRPKITPDKKIPATAFRAAKVILTIEGSGKDLYVSSNGEGRLTVRLSNRRPGFRAPTFYRDVACHDAIDSQHAVFSARELHAGVVMYVKAESKQNVPLILKLSDKNPKPDLKVNRKAERTLTLSDGQPIALSGTGIKDLCRLAAQCNRKVDLAWPGKLTSANCKDRGTAKHKCSEQAITAYNKNPNNQPNDIHTEVLYAEGTVPYRKDNGDARLYQSGKNKGQPILQPEWLGEDTATRTQQSSAEKARNDARKSVAENHDLDDKQTALYTSLGIKPPRRYRHKSGYFNEQAELAWAEDDLSDVELDNLHAASEDVARIEQAQSEAGKQAYDAAGGARHKPDVIRKINPAQGPVPGNIKEVLDFKFNCAYGSKGAIPKEQDDRYQAVFQVEKIKVIHPNADQCQSENRNLFDPNRSATPS